MKIGIAIKHKDRDYFCHQDFFKTAEEAQLYIKKYEPHEITLQELKVINLQLYVNLKWAYEVIERGYATKN